MYTFVCIKVHICRYKLFVSLFINFFFPKFIIAHFIRNVVYGHICTYKNKGLKRYTKGGIINIFTLLYFIFAKKYFYGYI